MKTNTQAVQEFVGYLWNHLRSPTKLTEKQLKQVAEKYNSCYAVDTLFLKDERDFDFKGRVELHADGVK